MIARGAVCIFSWDPASDGAVNKRDLSTGENGELAAEAALGGLLARLTGALLLALRRIANTANGAKCWGCQHSFDEVRSCQQNGVRSSKVELWLPGMDSNHDSRLQRPLSYH